jgi:hypothetical protein
VERDYLEYVGIDERIMDFQEVQWWGGMDWTDLAQNRDTWWVLVDALMNHQVP